MSALFKMSFQGLDQINSNSLSEPGNELLFKIFYKFGKRCFSIEQLYSLISLEKKPLIKLVYKLLHEKFIININKEEQVRSTKIHPEIPSLNNIASDNYILLSDINGLVLLTSGFTHEQSEHLAAQVTNLINNKISDNKNSQEYESPFPIFMNDDSLNISIRLFKINQLTFYITTKMNVSIYPEDYYDLLCGLVRRYYIEQ